MTSFFSSTMDRTWLSSTSVPDNWENKQKIAKYFQVLLCRAVTGVSMNLLVYSDWPRGERGTPQVVERWVDPDSSKCVLAASIDDRKKDHLICALVDMFGKCGSLREAKRFLMQLRRNKFSQQEREVDGG